MNENPLVSIGVPVYNEEQYLSLTLDSLLSQDYPNLELIFSDNASTDHTREICQEYVNKDSRVQYHRMETNVGAVKNFNFAFHQARGKYFMWAGAHDLWDSTFVSRAVSLIESAPSTVLVYPRTMLIDPEGQSLLIAPDEIDTRSLPALSRYLKFIWTIHWCNMIHGLIRSDLIRQTKLFRDVWGSDILLLGELSLLGEFAQIPDTLFYRRENRYEIGDKTLDEWKERYLATLKGSNNSEPAKASLPELFGQLRTALLKVLADSELPYPQKLRAEAETMICFRFRYGVPCPGGALLMAGRRITNRCKRMIGVTAT